jgi:hypothetical protein
MKKTNIIIFITVILSLCFSSCQKVIDIELNTSSSQIVIQGNINNQPGPYIVKISKTVDFDLSSSYPPVSGATVIISDNHGTIDTLVEPYPGTYVTTKILGIPGYTYSLVAIIGGISYSSVSVMPGPVEISSVYIENAIFGDSKQVTLSFNDPANIENYYRVIEYINGDLQTDFHVLSDELYDGDNIEYSIRSMGNDDDNKLEQGDTVTLWLLCIDKGVYDYFRTAGSDGTQSASPANPLSNIDNGALGYFNACYIKKASVVVP